MDDDFHVDDTSREYVRDTRQHRVRGWDDVGLSIRIPVGGFSFDSRTSGPRVSNRRLPE